MKSESAGVLAWGFSIAMATANVGCAAHAQATGYAEADTPVTFTQPPTLVEVDSDVWVASDSDYPVYFVGDTYWVYRDDVWYRSHTYDGHWARVDVNVVPTVIVRRDHRAYVHYHGAANARSRPAPRGPDGVGHEHRAEEPRGAPGQPPPQADNHGRGDEPPPQAGNHGRGDEPPPQAGNHGRGDDRRGKKDDRRDKRDHH